MKKFLVTVQFKRCDVAAVEVEAKTADDASIAACEKVKEAWPETDPTSLDPIEVEEVGY